MIDKNVLEKWDLLIQQLIEQTSVVVLESQDGVGSSFIAAFPKQIYQSESTEKQALKAVIELKTWRFGFLSYDVKNCFESLYSNNSNEIQLPEYWFMEPGLCVEWKHESNEWIYHEDVDFESSSQNEGSDSFEMGELISNETEESYKAHIKAIKEEIKEGLYYELNLSRLVKSSFSGSSFGLFKAMRAIGPVPMASFLYTKEWSICSSSPEVYIQKNGDFIESKPIKGTRKRSSNPIEDEQIKLELATSEKEKAENLMIVDLVRNDFNRIAESGSVNVRSMFNVETYSTVHQLVSTVEAKIKSDKTFFDVIEASFPMGSMTGAPKIEAMKAIERFENYRRNVYSGSIGLINPKQDAFFNVVIRTAIIRNKTLFYGVGGAITADSDPDSEWLETELKLEALKRAL